MNETPQIPQGLDRRDVRTFGEMANLVTRFEQLLARHSIVIERGSDLESVCLNIQDLESRRRKESAISPMEDIRPMWRQSAGLIEILRMLIAADAHNRIQPFIPHLRLMNHSPGAQNVKSVVFDEDSNKLFEMLVGLSCVQFSDDVVLDDPELAQGDNPDVLFSSEGIKWGIACKVVNGQSPLTMFERIDDGVRQIEASAASKGFVLLCLKNIIDHEFAWPLLNTEKWQKGEEEPIFGAFRDQEASRVREYLLELAATKTQDLLTANGLVAVSGLFEGTRVLPGIGFFLQTTASVSLPDGRPMVTTVGVLHWTTFGVLAAHDRSLLNTISESLHHRVWTDDTGQ
jgi:hypothetical protein